LLKNYLAIRKKAKKKIGITDNRYERHGANHNRTLINQFATSTCWCCVISNIFGTLPEAVLTLLGPFNKTFCFIHTVSKNTIFVQYIVNLTAISIVRNFYVFVKKNPTGQNDDFICFFVNVATFVNAVVWQITHQLTNGFNRHTYYICCGALPDTSVKSKMNYSLNLLMVLSPVVFLIVISKIRLYKKKVGSFLVQEPQSNSLPSSVELILKTSIADLVTVGVGLLVVVPSTILILHLVNRT
jgi:hypothetical protein